MVNETGSESRSLAGVNYFWALASSMVLSAEIEDAFTTYHRINNPRIKLYRQVPVETDIHQINNCIEFIHKEWPVI